MGTPETVDSVSVISEGHSALRRSWSQGSSLSRYVSRRFMRKNWAIFSERGFLRKKGGNRTFYFPANGLFKVHCSSGGAKIIITEDCWASLWKTVLS